MNFEIEETRNPSSHAGEKTKRRWWRFRWSDILWGLVYPRGGPRITATPSGAVLIALAFGIGLAAYNASNNILFITLSLLLACLILSGMMSTVNFRGVGWRVLLAPPLRAGHDALVTLELTNRKRLLPSYGLWFDLVAIPPLLAGLPAVRASDRPRKRLFLRERLGPGTSVRLDWVFRPERRGLQRFELEGVGSLFPFGFLRKSIASALRREIIVWPAPVEYRWQGAASARPQPSGQRYPRAGAGSDLLALRRFAPGDSHRMIHWKASARQQQLLVRQFSAESQQVFALWVRTPAEVWTRPEQFELLVGFAASLAEDLFRAGRLRTLSLNGGRARPVGRVRDLEAFLDELAVVQPVPEADLGTVSSDNSGDGISSTRNLLSFVPDGPRGVAALIDGKRAATA
jgi:uncharacterized protein (DUF58 family)